MLTTKFQSDRWKFKFSRPWKYNELMTLARPWILYRSPSDQVGTQFKIGDDFLYKGCRYVDGVFYRVFDSCSLGIDFGCEDRGYLADAFRK